MTLLLTNPDIAPLLEPEGFIDALDAAYRSFAMGKCVSVPRIDAQGPCNASGETYQLGLATGIADARYAAVRLKSDMVFERVSDGRRTKEKYGGRPGRYLGLILLFSIENGDLLAIMHDGLIQQMRVGADSALGVRYMARHDASVLAVVGSGGMAGSHLACISAVRRLSKVRVFSPTEANRERFAAKWRARGIDVEAVASAENAVADADIVSACTNAIGPVIFERHLRAGQHVTAIGGMLDPAAARRVDVALRFGTATAPAGMADWRFEDEALGFSTGDKASAGGTLRFAEIPEERRIMLSDLLADPGKGRRSADQITFSERGNIHGIQFAAVAGHVYEAARKAGAGTQLPAETFLEEIRN